MLFVMSCKDEPLTPAQTVGHPGDTLQRTLIVYMAAENSLLSFAPLDSLELAEGLAQVGDDCRLVLFIDDANSTRLCVGTKDTPLQTILTYDRNLVSTDSATMASVLSYIVDRYPARHYGLVFWSHASGWIFQNGTRASAPRRTFGIDNGHRSSSNTGREMNIPVLRRLLEDLPHFDYLFFDACFMQNIEVAYELRNCADYIVASPAEIPGNGAPYHEVLPQLTAVPADLEGLINAYADYYVTGEGRYRFAGAELSVVRTSKLEALAVASRPLIRQLFGGHTTPLTYGVQFYVASAVWPTFSEGFDMENLFYRCCPPDDYAAWKVALSEAVPFKRLTPQWTSAFTLRPMQVSDADHCSGVTLFVPSASFEERGWTQDYRRLEWYDAVQMNETGW